MTTITVPAPPLSPDVSAALLAFMSAQSGVGTGLAPEGSLLYLSGTGSSQTINYSINYLGVDLNDGPNSFSQRADLRSDVVVCKHTRLCRHERQ